MPSPSTSKKATSGVIDRVPCPHCGKTNDLRQLKAQMLLLEKARLDCDHCGRVMMVVGTRKVEVVTMIQSPHPADQGRVVKPPVRVREGTTVSLSKVKR